MGQWVGQWGGPRGLANKARLKPPASFARSGRGRSQKGAAELAYWLLALCASGAGWPGSVCFSALLPLSKLIRLPGGLRR
jgi:hypothetical protein